MFHLKMRPQRCFAIGVAVALSLVFISALLVIIASAQSNAPRTWGQPELDVVQSILQGGIVRIEPAVSVVGNGETFCVSIMIYDAVNLGGFQFFMEYDPAIIEVVSAPHPVALGPFLGSTGRTVMEIKNEVNPATGVITYMVFTYGSAAGPNGDGMLAFVDLKARALGTTDLDLKGVEVTDTGGTSQTVAVGDGLVVVAIPPAPAQVSVTKNVHPAVVTAQGLLTHTLQRSLSVAGQHSYNEIVFDPIPSNTTYLMGSATLNGTPAPQLYSATLNAIYYQHSGVFTNADQWMMAFQVRVGSVPSGTFIVNTVTQTTSFDGAADSGPYTSTSRARVCTIPTTPTLSAPANGGSTCDTTPSFDWSSVSGATSYRIQVDNNSNFSSPEINTTVTGSDYTPGSPLSPGTYYWRVRASNSCGNSAWSSTWSFTILSLPAAPSLSSPSDGSSTCDTMPSFDWSSVSGATSYRIQVDNNSNFSSPVIDTTTANSAYTPVSALLPGTYYWRVRAVNSCGAGPWSVKRALAVQACTYLPIVLKNY